MDVDIDIVFFQYLTLREKVPYSEFFWSVSILNPNAEKYRPEKLGIRTTFTQCNLISELKLVLKPIMKLIFPSHEKYQ